MEVHGGEVVGGERTGGGTGRYDVREGRGGSRGGRGRGDR